jgi:hypothetical protein
MIIYLFRLEYRKGCIIRSGMWDGKHEIPSAVAAEADNKGGGVLPLHRTQDDPATAISVECLRLLWWWRWWWWWCLDEDGILCRNDLILRLHRLNRLGDDEDPSESAAPPLSVSSADESDESLLLLLLPMPPLLLLLLDQKPVFTMFSLARKGLREKRSEYIIIKSMEEKNPIHFVTGRTRYTVIDDNRNSKIKTKRTTIEYHIIAVYCRGTRLTRTSASDCGRRWSLPVQPRSYYSFRSRALRGGDRPRAQNLVTGQTRHPFETDISSTLWKCLFLRTRMHTQIARTQTRVLRIYLRWWLLQLSANDTGRCRAEVAPKL